MQFHPSTSQQEARALTASMFKAIAAGWPIVYGKISTVAMNGGPAGPTVTGFDTDRMMRDAADLAAKLTHAVEERILEVPESEAGR